MTLRAPAPWIVVGDTVKCIDHGHRYLVARVHNSSFKPEANQGNAQLIAAAPDLLAFAERIARLPPHGEYVDLIDEARAAIAKATGDRP